MLMNFNFAFVVYTLIDYWDEEDNRAKVLWIKSLNRLRTQVPISLFTFNSVD